MIMPRATGHLFARSGHLLRVDIIAGQWTATKFTPNLTIVQQVVGTDEFVHKQILRWLRPENVAVEQGGFDLARDVGIPIIWQKRVSPWSATSQVAVHIDTFGG